MVQIYELLAVVDFLPQETPSLLFPIKSQTNTFRTHDFNFVFSGIRQENKQRISLKKLGLYIQSDKQICKR
jgi:hypothetical protein